MSCYIEAVVPHKQDSVSDFEWFTPPKKSIESEKQPTITFSKDDAVVQNPDTPESPGVAIQPTPVPVTVSSPVEWQCAELPEIPSKRKRGRPPGAKNKPRAPGEKRTVKALYDPGKQADAKAKFIVFLKTRAFKCRQGDNGGRDTLAVIAGSFHRFCGVTKVCPRMFVDIITEWAMALPEPWLAEKNCSAADSWWRKLSLACLDIFATLVTENYRDGRKLGGSDQSKMYRLISILELWHHLHFRDTASSYWRKHVIERECQKSTNGIGLFETWRRTLAMNSSRLGSLLRDILKTHFDKPFEEILAMPNRRDILEGRIVDLDNHRPSTAIDSVRVSVASEVGNDDLLDNGLFPTVEAFGGLYKNNPIRPWGGNTDRSNDTERMNAVHEQNGQIMEQAMETGGDRMISSMMPSEQAIPTSTHISFNHHPHLENVHGVIIAETIVEQFRRSDGSLDLACQEVYSYILNSPFLPIQDYPISFFSPATWNDKTLEVRPGASARLQNVSRSVSTSCKVIAQKKYRYSICAAPMAMAIDIIKNDESLKIQTTELRKQIQLEEEHFEGNRESSAEEWRKQILTGRVNCEMSHDEEKRRYREIAEHLPHNIKRRLPSIVPSGWTYPRDYFDGRYFRKNERKIVNDAIIQNGIVCADFDHLGDQLPVAMKRLIESGLCSLVAISASGDGLYAMIRYNKTHYWGMDGFHAAREAIWSIVERMGLKLDQSCKDISRRRFLAHDPELWIDESDTARLTD